MKQRDMTHSKNSAAVSAAKVLLALSMIICINVYAANGDNNGLKHRVEALEALVIDLQAQIGANNGAAAANAEKLQHVSVVYGDINGVAGPHFIIEGTNVHVRSGAGTTAEGCDGFDFDCAGRTGLGNLIVGYNEPREDFFGTAPDCAVDPNALDPDGASICTHRNGAHHLVVGLGNNFTGHGGFLAGIFNEGRGSHTSVSGGRNNSAFAPYSAVSGGIGNFASGTGSSVSGGFINRAIGRFSSASGGTRNEAVEEFTSILGGHRNITFGFVSSIGGGEENVTFGSNAFVGGGFLNTAEGINTSVTGGAFNNAIGFGSSISGGADNRTTFTGDVASILGGFNKTAATIECTVGDDGVDC